MFVNVKYDIEKVLRKNVLDHTLGASENGKNCLMFIIVTTITRASFR